MASPLKDRLVEVLVRVEVQANVRDWTHWVDPTAQCSELTREVTTFVEISPLIAAEDVQKRVFRNLFSIDLLNRCALASYLSTSRDNKFLINLWGKAERNGVNKGAYTDYFSDVSEKFRFC